jgi:hypothetical protein
MVPIMTMWGYSQKMSQGTSLVVITAIAPLAIVMYAVFGNVDFGFAIPLAIGGLIGGEIGSRIACRMSNRNLAIAFSILLVLVALRMLFLKIPEQVDVPQLTMWGFAGAGCLGILAGLAAGFFGVGGGIVFVPIGVLLAGLPQVVAQGSSWTAILPTSFFSAHAYHREKEIAAELLKWLIPGALAGVVLGAKGADFLPGRILQEIFALYLLYTGISRLLKTGRHHLLTCDKA